MLALPVVLVFWAGGYLWKRTGWLSVKDIDVDTGRRPVDWDAIKAKNQQIAEYPAWKRIFHTLF